MSDTGTERTINIDGREFSKETVKQALKKHCNFESDIQKILKVDTFIAVEASEKLAFPYLVGCASRPEKLLEDWDKNNTVHDEDTQIHWFNREEVEQIIAGLQGLLDS